MIKLESMIQLFYFVKNILSTVVKNLLDSLSYLLLSRF